MDYERKYKEALEKARQLCLYPTTKPFISDLQNLFPELRESDDERIRKSLLDYLHTLPNHFSHNGGLVTDWIAWLEKQGEQKQYDIDILEKHITKDSISELAHTVIVRNGWEIVDAKEQKPADKVEPKFHEGEWITNGDYTWKIVDVKPLDYILQPQDGIIVDDTISHVDEQFHSFTIEDAKDGDVLFMDNGAANCVFIYKSSNNGIINKYASYNNFGFECEHYLVLNDGYVIPATKEQRDTLIKAMTDAGYTFDFEKKELKKIEKESSWSEEDEYRINRISDFIWKNRKGDTDEIYQQEQDVNWLKSLRPQPKQEWSKEDETKMRAALAFIKSEFPKKGNEEIMEDTIAWLKSLKDRYTWKPSKEQIEALHDLNLTGDISYMGQARLLIELYNDLKKLTE